MIYCIGIVLAGFTQGTKSEDKIKTLKDLLSVFTFLEESVELWEKDGKLSFSLIRAGKSAPLSDCYITAFSYIIYAPSLSLYW
jgi:hypothetical protein